eukprot:Gb_15169 [translate_table: standard]
MAFKVNVFSFVPLILSIIPLSSPAIQSHLQRNDAHDELALSEFRKSIISDPRNALQNWNPNHTFCNWTGVACNLRKQRVVVLDLRGMGLEGSISPFIGNLSFLRVIALANNSFTGIIPPQLGNLFRLKELRLNSNKLEGPIPYTITRCYKLEFLVLSANKLSGNIPPKLGVLNKLEFVDIGSNHLTGAIPSSLSNISSLKHLSIDANNISGAIPSQLGLLVNLEYLVLGENQLIGPIPASLSNCTSLRVLNLYHNHLTGFIPQDFGAKLSNLQQLRLLENQLSGDIPISLGNCSKLTWLSLGQNGLTGMVPVELGKLVLLRRLYLYSNHLVSGSSTTLPFLTALTNCSLLEWIDMAHNPIGGILPVSIGQLSTKLTFLSLFNNSIRGSIPQEIANITSLTLLALERNFLTGTIPLDFKLFQKMERLYLGINKLEGSIPSEIGKLPSLGILSLGQNMLSGKIPDSIGNLQQLRRLYLNQNKLSGKIPASLGDCRRLELLDLSYNSLTGRIPPEVASLANVLFYFNISSNSLQGSLRPQMGKMVMVQAIDISSNQLSGVIPSALGSCTALEYLNLSQNAFQGPIPLSFRNLNNLQDMDLSFNNLSGAIPISLEKIKPLRHLNFSFNNLRGEVPKSGIFENLTAASFIGNPGLCGTIIDLPVCPSSSPKRDHSLVIKVTVPVVVISIVFISCCLLLGFLWNRRSKRRRSHLSTTSTLKLGHPRISYQELVDATNGFSEANLVGVGSFGSVYRGILTDGTIVAVKVLADLQNKAAQRSFSTECEVLRGIRHRNLVKIITACSNLDDFKCLVLPYMSNGSLEKHLYPNGGNDCTLSLIDRVKIAIDIAHGMAYLHHHASVQVVHCDLKPSNVLLDDIMTAHITDFGIARLTCSDSLDSFANSTLVLRGSIGYIAPEYGLGTGRASTKGDVYSYGILLLEMVTRKRPSSDMFVDGLDLHKWASMAFPDKIEEVVDGNLLRDTYNEGMDRQREAFHCLSELIHVSLMCTKESPEERPNMIEVVRLVENIRKIFKVSRLPTDTSDLVHSGSGVDNIDRWASGSQICPTNTRAMVRSQWQRNCQCAMFLLKNVIEDAAYEGNGQIDV